MITRLGVSDDAPPPRGGGHSGEVALVMASVTFAAPLFPKFVPNCVPATGNWVGAAGVVVADES
jgi:hypothetical protein